MAVLELLGELGTSDDPLIVNEEVERYLSLMTRRPRKGLGEDVTSPGSQGKLQWKWIFIWQAPAMLVSYSVTLFLLGLTLYVCTPLIQGHGWTPGSIVRPRMPHGNLERQKPHADQK